MNSQTATGILAYPVTLLVALGAWQGCVNTGFLPHELVPYPIEVGRELLAKPAFYGAQTWVTAEAAILGLLVSFLVSLVLALIMQMVGFLAPFIRSFAILSQTVPVAAAAPIIFFVFGFGFGSKILIVFLISFFPLLIVLMEEFEHVQAWLRNQLSALALPRLKIFFLVSLPVALRGVGAGLKTAAVLAVIGAAIAELVVPEAGLGRIIVNSTTQYNETAMIAAFCLLMVLGLLLFLIGNVVSRALQLVVLVK